MRLVLLTFSALALAGCDQLGLELPAQVAAAKEAEGRAVGGACRHSGRALEDCYTLNPKAHKAAIFTGWRDMDAYMRENSIEVVSPVLATPDTTAGKKKKSAVATEATEGGDKAAEPAAKDASHGTVEPTLTTPTQGGKIV